MNDPLATALVSVRSSYDGRRGTVSRARTHEVARASALSFDSKEPLPTSIEVFLAAIAADLLGTFGRLARHRRLIIDEAEAVLSATLADPLVYLGVVGSAGVPRLSSLVVRAHIGTPSPPASVREAWDDALQRSPLLNTLRPSVELAVHLNFTD